MSRKDLFGRMISVIFLMIVPCAIALAQYRASIQGTVTDAQGAVVAGATLTLTNKDTNRVQTTVSGAEGVYSFGGLGPGHYMLTAEKQGFKKQVFSDVVVSAEQAQAMNVRLEIGDLTEAVTVSAPVADILTTESANVGGILTHHEVEKLPSFARDPYQLLRLAPGVFGDGALSGGGGTQSLPGTNIGGPSATDSIFKVENGVQMVADGTRQNSNNFQVDGVSVNSTSWGGAAVITPNEESVKEVRIVANNYSAESGRTSGAQIMVVSQNGTNNLHGSAFFKFHRPGLNAYQAWNGPGTPSPVSKDQARFDQFGGSLGGPIVKNRLFYFFSYETLRNNSFSVGTAWFETSQFLQSAGPSSSIARKLLSYPGEGPSFTKVVSLSCSQVGLPSTQCRDVAGGLDLGSPLKGALGTQDPTYGQAGTPYGIGSGFDGTPDAQFLQTASPNVNTSEQFNGRMDFQASSKDLLTFSIYSVPLDSHFYNGPARAANQWNHSSLAQSLTAIYSRTFSATMLNEARFGLSGWNWNEVDSNPQEPWGLPTANIYGIGSVGIQSYGAPGPSIFDQKTYNARDTLSKVVGSHTMKFGADVSRALFLDEAPWSARPNYDFRNMWEFANDAPIHENANFDPVTGQPTAALKNLRFNIVGIFFQDDWKVKPNLTLNLGLRWEYFSPLTETNGNIANVLLGQGGNSLTGLSLTHGGDLFHTSKNNWGPQTGFAWSPQSLFGHDFNNKLVLRGGFGIAYNLEQLAITSNGRFNPPFLVSLDLYGSDIKYATNSSPTQFTGWPSNPAAVQQFNLTTGLPVTGAPVSLTGFPNFMPSTATYHYSMDVQYEVAHNWVATIGYQGSQSRHYTRQSQLNWIWYPALNPRVQSLSWYSNDTNAHYNALNTEIQHRLSGTFEVDAQYRLSRSIDQGSQDYNMDPYPWNYSFTNGPSDFDVTHNVKLWGVWSPKLFAGSNGWMQKVAGGWTLSGILNFHSGFPWTPGYCNTAGNVVYPNSGYYNCLLPAAYTGGAGSNFSNSTFMSANGNFPNGALAYLTVPTWPATGRYPAPSSAVSRNMFRGPRYLGNDFTFAKSFGFPRVPGIGETARLDLKASFFNLFNKLNLTNINSTISNDGVTSNPLFGQAQNGLAGRIVEIQARFSF